MRHGRAEEAHVITTVPQNANDEFDRRRRRYLIMMAGRVLCVIGAVATYHVSLWLAFGFVVAGGVLPWCAVLIANDRPPKRKVRRPPPTARAEEAALPSAPDRTVDG